MNADHRPHTYVLPFYQGIPGNNDLDIPEYSGRSCSWLSIRLDSIETGWIVMFAGSPLMIREFAIGERLIVGYAEVPLSHLHAACPIPLSAGVRVEAKIARLTREDIASRRLSAVIDVLDPRPEAPGSRLLVCPGGFTYHPSEAAPMRLPAAMRLRGRG